MNHADTAQSRGKESNELDLPKQYYKNKAEGEIMLNELKKTTITSKNELEEALAQKVKLQVEVIKVKIQDLVVEFLFYSKVDNLALF